MRTHAGPSKFDVVEKALLEIELPEGFGMYDFGGGWTVAPVPDLDGSGYLKDFMVAIEYLDPTEGVQGNITGFTFELQSVTPEQLKEGLLKAVEHNKTQAMKFETLK